MGLTLLIGTRTVSGLWRIFPRRQALLATLMLLGLLDLPLPLPHPGRHLRPSLRSRPRQLLGMPRPPPHPLEGPFSRVSPPSSWSNPLRHQCAALCSCPRCGTIGPRTSPSRGATPSSTPDGSLAWLGRRLCRAPCAGPQMDQDNTSAVMDASS